VIPSLPLPADEVHLWHLSVPVDIDRSVEARALGWLSAGEHLRHARLRFDRDRWRNLLSRALVRSTLSRYAPHVAPQDWGFDNNAHGRPAIASQHIEAGRIRFNLSHCADRTVLAVVLGRDVGVDIESISRAAPVQLASRYFSRDEVESLQELPAEARPRRFWTLWTLKESYLKARGVGLAGGLDSFSVVIDDEGYPFLDGGPGDLDAGDRWDLMQPDAGAQHLMAVCVRMTAGTRPRLVSHQLSAEDLVALQAASCPRRTKSEPHTGVNP
jgi:4'-phosphopantetheinyl transferase